MTAPLIADPATWMPNGTLVNAALMKTQVTDPVNTLAAATTPNALLMTRAIGSTNNVPTNTLYAIASYSATAYDVGDLTVSGGIITAADTGLYEWAGTVAWPNLAAGGTTYRASTFITINGVQPASDPGRDDRPVIASLGAINQTAGGLVTLNAGDTIQLAVYQSSGSTVNGVQIKTFSLARVA